MKKQYTDTRTSREAMGRLRTDLRDVQNIMFTNIQDVMSRGESLQGKTTRRSAFQMKKFFCFFSLSFIRSFYKSN